MKAKIRKTGEIVNIAEYSKITLEQCDSWGNPIELKPEEVELIQEQTEDEHWQNVREQKAKAYDEAIDAMKDCIPDEDGYVTIRPCDIFHELKESEDERIRKWLEGLIEAMSDNSIEFKDVRRIDVLHWLEKQGEQKHTIEMKSAEESLGIDSATYNKIVDEVIYGEQKLSDKVKPMFNVGEWVTNSIETVQITGYDIDYGYQVNYKGNLQHRDTDIIEKEYHLWTVQDAKDGDVLATCRGAFIYNGNNGGGSCPGCYCGINTLGNFKTGTEHYWTRKKVYPATKEQRDLLFKKMHEAGYEWVAEKKELKKTNYQPRVADYEDFREWEDEKSEAEMVGMEDPVLQRLDKILDVLMEIKINTVLRQPYITSDPPQPIQPWYGTETVTCGEQASTETTTNALDDERPETTM